MYQLLLTISILAPWAQDQATEWEAVSNTVRATLHDRAEVRGVELRLADIADITGVDADVVAKARRIPIGRTPGPGRAALLTAETIQSILDRSGRKDMDIRVDGAASVQVLSETLTLSAGEVDTLARRWLWRALGWRGDSSHVRPASTTQPLSVAAGRWSTSFEVTPEEPGKPLAGLVSLRVRAIIDGRPAAGTTVRMMVKRPTKALVLTRRVPAGRPIQPDDVRVEQRLADGRHPDLITDMAGLQELVTRRTLAAGTAISRRDLKGRPVVFRNDRVDIHVIHGALTVTGSGRAMEAGAPGSIIAVRSDESRRILQVKVLDSRTVEHRLHAGGSK